MLRLSRRPEPRGAEDIGSWHGVLAATGYVAVITNLLLVVFYTPLTAGLPAGELDSLTVKCVGRPRWCARGRAHARAAGS